MAGLPLELKGLTFDNLKAALTDLYFRFDGMTQEQFDEAQKYVVPMQHNIMNPLTAGGGDTYIQYWINRDDRLVREIKVRNINSSFRVAHCTVRFLGHRAEAWAHAFTAISETAHFKNVFRAYCNGFVLPYISPIVVQNVDFFGVGNTSKAFIMSFQIEYDELIDYSKGSGGGDGLEYISLSDGFVAREAK